MEEMWRDIKGYEGLYQVSNLGRVKSLSRFHNNNSGGYLSKERILKQSIKRGYLTVGLCNSGKVKTYSVHRLVAIAFIDNPNNKKAVNHIDGNKTNNNVDNLEWCTYSENQKHAYKTGLHKSTTGEKSSFNKLNAIEVEDIRKNFDGNYKKIAEKYSVSERTIKRIIKRETWC